MPPTPPPNPIEPGRVFDAHGAGATAAKESEAGGASARENCIGSYREYEGRREYFQLNDRYRKRPEPPGYRKRRMAAMMLLLFVLFVLLFLSTRLATMALERDAGGSVVQALHLMNSNRLIAKLSQEGGRAAALARSKLEPRQIVEELYLAAYRAFRRQRRPTSRWWHFRAKARRGSRRPRT